MASVDLTAIKDKVQAFEDDCRRADSSKSIPPPRFKELLDVKLKKALDRITATDSSIDKTILEAELEAAVERLDADYRKEYAAREEEKSANLVDNLGSLLSSLRKHEKPPVPPRKIMQPPGGKHIHPTEQAKVTTFKKPSSYAMRAAHRAQGIVKGIKGMGKIISAASNVQLDFQDLHPQAISILKDSKDRKKIDKKAFAKVLLQPKVGDKAIALVSIAGAFRKGKSFMLNFFIRYLRHRGWVNKGWMYAEGNKVNGGFHWKGGQTADTQGILIWSEPFIVEKSGHWLAIFLMDTQGLYDGSTPKALDTQIFALSTLLSSVQIINISQQLQENDLESLEFFTEYAKTARGVTGNKKPFQKLLFLVRDWPYPNEDDFGVKGGNSYLKRKLEIPIESAASSLISVRKKLYESFDSIECFLMPHPGKRVAETERERTFDGDMQDIDDEFLTAVQPLCELLLHPKNLLLKKIGGQSIRARMMLDFAKKYGDAFSSGEMPEVKNMLELTEDLMNSEAHLQCIDYYDDMMRQDDGANIADGANNVLDSEHVRVKKATLRLFDDKAKFGNAEKRKARREHLQIALDQALLKFQSQWRYNRVQSGLELEQEAKKEKETYDKTMEEQRVNASDIKAIKELHDRSVEAAFWAIRQHEGATEAQKENAVRKLRQHFDHTIKIFEERVRRKAEEERIQNLIEVSLKTYEKRMAEMCDEGFVDPQELKRAGDSIAEEIVSRFEEDTEANYPELGPKELEGLKSEIKRLTSQFEDSNVVKKV